MQPSIFCDLLTYIIYGILSPLLIFTMCTIHISILQLKSDIVSRLNSMYITVNEFQPLLYRERAAVGTFYQVKVCIPSVPYYTLYMKLSYAILTCLISSCRRSECNDVTYQISQISFIMKNTQLKM